MSNPITPFNINPNLFGANTQQSALPFAFQAILGDLLSTMQPDSFANTNFNITPGNFTSSQLPDASSLGFNQQFTASLNSIFDFINMFTPQIPVFTQTPVNTTTPVSPTNTATGIQTPVNDANKPLLVGIPQESANVFVVDNFTPDNTGFNHGQEIVNTIINGGSRPELQGHVNVQAIDTGGSLSNIQQALQQILTGVQNGERVNAVNLSLVDFTPDEFTEPIQQLITQLSGEGVPVLVAAGNDGIDNKNLLAGDGAIIVQSTTNGEVNANSGPGTVQSEGSTTSFATANLTPTIAANNQVKLEQANGIEPTPVTPENATTTAPTTTPAATGETTTTTAPVTQTVKSGDNLSKIAAQHGISWQQLYEANKDLIGDNPNLIFPGQELVIPGADSPASTGSVGPTGGGGEDKPPTPPSFEENTHTYSENIQRIRNLENLPAGIRNGNTEIGEEINRLKAENEALGDTINEQAEERFGPPPLPGDVPI